MNSFDSECSSGCESGWTLYLEHSLLPPISSCRENYFLSYKNGCLGNQSFERRQEEEEEEEDLSMVSDASSGPPHFHESHFGDDNGFSYSAPQAVTFTKSNGKRQKVKENLIPYDSSILDDTASSPIFNFSAKNGKTPSSRESSLDFSHGFSATHLEDRRRLEAEFRETS